MKNESNEYEIIKNWKRQKFKEKLDKGNNRHPMMTLLRTSAEKRLQNMFKNIPDVKNKPLSTFDEKIIEPSGNFLF